MVAKILTIALVLCGVRNEAESVLSGLLEVAWNVILWLLGLFAFLLLCSLVLAVVTFALLGLSMLCERYKLKTVSGLVDGVAYRFPAIALVAGFAAIIAYPFIF